MGRDDSLGVSRRIWLIFTIYREGYRQANMSSAMQKPFRPSEGHNPRRTQFRRLRIVNAVLSTNTLMFV